MRRLTIVIVIIFMQVHAHDISADLASLESSFLLLNQALSCPKQSVLQESIESTKKILTDIKNLNLRQTKTPTTELGQYISNYIKTLGEWFSDLKYWYLSSRKGGI